MPNSAVAQFAVHKGDDGRRYQQIHWRMGKRVRKCSCDPMTYEYAYELDKDHRDSLVATLSRYVEDTFLDQLLSFRALGTLYELALVVSSVAAVRQGYVRANNACT